MILKNSYLIIRTKVKYKNIKRKIIQKEFSNMTKQSGTKIEKIKELNP